MENDEYTTEILTLNHKVLLQVFLHSCFRRPKWSHFFLCSQHCKWYSHRCLLSRSSHCCLLSPSQAVYALYTRNHHELGRGFQSAPIRLTWASSYSRLIGIIGLQCLGQVERNFLRRCGEFLPKILILN